MTDTNTIGSTQNDDCVQCRPFLIPVSVSPDLAEEIAIIQGLIREAARQVLRDKVD